eukprot:3247134-Pyramimonas_sp.AAC.1
MRVPPAVINFGVNIGGRHTDGVIYTMFLRSTNFENLKEKRQFNSGAALIDVGVHAGEERIDQTWRVSGKPAARQNRQALASPTSRF